MALPRSRYYYFFQVSYVLTRAQFSRSKPIPPRIARQCTSSSSPSTTANFVSSFISLMCALAGSGRRRKEACGDEEEEDNASKRWTQRAIPETFDQKQSVGGFCKMERKARAGGLLERPPSSFSIVILVVTESLVVGRVRENSAPLQLTIAIKILPRAPPYELRTLAGRLTSATLAVTSGRTRGRGSEDLVSTGDKRSMLQRVRISFPGGRRRVYWD